MNTTVEFLDAVKAKTGLPSDYAIAPVLGVTRSAVSKYRNGKDFLGEETALRVAHILDLEPAAVLAAIQAEKAKTDEGKAAWKLIYEKLGGIAASVAMAAILFPGSPTPASAATKELSNSVYYVKSRRRLNPNPFLQILNPFLPAL